MKQLFATTPLTMLVVIAPILIVVPVWAQQSPGTAPDTSQPVTPPQQQQQPTTQQQQRQRQQDQDTRMQRHPSGSLGDARRGPGSRARAHQEDNRATTALNLLVANGYTQWSDFHRTGNYFEARVIKDGRPMLVRVDPDAKTIAPVG